CNHTITYGSQCESTYTIIYNDPMKFNEVKTTDALKQSLSNIDFSADVLDGIHGGVICTSVNMIQTLYRHLQCPPFQAR
ncbi:MAG: hypothetical protein KGH99_03080, partial [Thaumarchaeota archaeon]|nr:hypothetical protein [Nitrososphaerota archaeon]